MPCENPRTEKKKHFQNRYVYTCIVRNVKWHEYSTLLGTKAILFLCRIELFLLKNSKTLLKTSKTEIGLYIAKVTFVTLFQYWRHTSFFEVIRKYTCGEGHILMIFAKHVLIMSQMILNFLPEL